MPYTAMDIGSWLQEEYGTNSNQYMEDECEVLTLHQFLDSQTANMNA